MREKKSQRCSMVEGVMLVYNNMDVQPKLGGNVVCHQHEHPSITVYAHGKCQVQNILAAYAKLMQVGTCNNYWLEEVYADKNDLRLETAVTKRVEKIRQEHAAPTNDITGPVAI